MVESKSDMVKIKPAELENLVVELYKQGETPARIGLILRDKHGVPKAKAMGKRITQILKEAKVPVKTEKEIYQEKMKILEGHIAKNKHDHAASRSLTKKLWTVSKLK